MEFRLYRPEDCAGIIRLFYDTVHTVNRKDYTQEQVNAWAPDALIGDTGLPRDVGMSAGPTLSAQILGGWNRSFLEHYTVVAEDKGRIAGFGDIDAAGYLDRLYVHKDAQGRGIASSICALLERHCAGPSITTHASVTAKPFFEQRGYAVIREQEVERRGVLLTNYVMTLQTPAPPSSP